MWPVSYKTDAVFGISRDLPLNYTTRQSADNFLIENLTRDKHLVIYGSSKQGKTCLRKHCLQSSDYIVVHCSNRWTLAELHTAILKASGYEVTQSSTRTASGKQKVLAKVGASFFGNKAEGGAEIEKDNVESKTTSPLELDPEDVNDIISALKNLAFEKYVVLEDFHYLSFETQRDFSVALKAFHEASEFCFLIVGVWLEENRLTVYNGDLTGRVVSINADKWTHRELAQVMDAGEQLLNIKFADNFRQDLLGSCFENVYLLQEACYRCCKTEKISETQQQVLTVGTSCDCKKIVSDVVNEQTGRFNSFITQFSDGFQDTTLEMYRWILYPILTADSNKLEEGIRQKEMRDILKQKHPQKESLNPGNLTQALQSCASLQVKKDIKPIILDYDQTNLRLTVVDRSFIIWLHNQDVNDVLELAGLPTLAPRADDLDRGFQA